MIEIWKDIKGYEGLYQISNTGRVKSLDRILEIVRNGTNQTTKRKGYILSPEISDKGYYRVKLHKNNIGSKQLVSVLVAKSFVSILFPYPAFEVNHKDCNKLNNHYTNLEFVTHRNNIKHAFVNNLISRTRGDSHHSSKLTSDIVLQIRNKYKTGDYSMKSLGNLYKVSPTSIMNIVNYKLWV